jgi:hypothetical protein
MLADQLDYVVGVDPHRDLHALAVVHVLSGAVVLETTIAAGGDGYARALKLVEVHASGRRAFAVEGTGSFGAGLTRFLTGRGERCSRSAGCAGSVARAARSTPLTLSAPPAACLPRSGRRRRGLAVNGKRCRHSWLHGKERSTPSAPDWANSEICLLQPLSRYAASYDR